MDPTAVIRVSINTKLGNLHETSKALIVLVYISCTGNSVVSRPIRLKDEMPQTKQIIYLQLHLPQGHLKVELYRCGGSRYSQSKTTEATKSAHEKIFQDIWMIIY